MGIFDSEDKPIDFTGIPGWELPGHQAGLKRQMEEQAITQVLPDEQSKQAVNRHVAVNHAIHGVADPSRFPIELDDTGRKA